MCDENMAPITDDEVEESIPLLPPVPENYEGMKTLSLGDTMSLDFLGPIIINPDGTTRRISNWDTLSKQEQESSWRRISERNKIRLAQLKGDREKADEVTPPLATDNHE